MDFITHDLAQPGSQNSLLLSHNVISAHPSGYLGYLRTSGCVYTSVLLGQRSRQDEPNTKLLGIRKTVSGMPRIPSGNFAVWNRRWIWVQCVCVCICSQVSDIYSNKHPLSLFLLRPEPAVSTHETRIMGQLFGKAYYGMRTHPLLHTNTLRDRDGYNIAGDRNQAVPVLSDQNVMMLWIPKIPKWSGLFPTIDGCCRQLPKSSPECNKTKSMLH